VSSINEREGGEDDMLGKGNQGKSTNKVPKAAEGAETKTDSSLEGFKTHDGTVCRLEAGSMRKEFHRKDWKR
jgi:hypothetical protein